MTTIAMVAGVAIVGATVLYFWHRHSTRTRVAKFSGKDSISVIAGRDWDMSLSASALPALDSEGDLAALELQPFLNLCRKF